MGLKQSNIFGGYEEVYKKDIKKNAENIPPPRKSCKLKQKVDILYSMYEELYNRLYEKQYINLLDMMLDLKIVDKKIIVYPEDKQAEPADIIDLTLFDIDKKINRMKEVLQDFQ